MKIVKFSSIMLLSVFFLWICTPQLSAKHYKKCKSRSTSFSLNFNLEPRARYVEHNYVYSTAVPAYERVTVAPYRPYVEERIYYPAYRQQVIIERPYAERVYVHPQYSYWGY